MPISEEESTVLSRSFRPVSLTSFGQSIPSAACAALADGISTFTTRSASFAHAPDVPMLSRPLLAASLGSSQKTENKAR